jgi:hypothetical protein
MGELDPRLGAVGTPWAGGFIWPARCDIDHHLMVLFSDGGIAG